MRRVMPAISQKHIEVFQGGSEVALFKWSISFPVLHIDSSNFQWLSDFASYIMLYSNEKKGLRRALRKPNKDPQNL